jgi:hypothetical protein
MMGNAAPTATASSKSFDLSTGGPPTFSVLVICRMVNHRLMAGNIAEPRARAGFRRESPHLAPAALALILTL